MRLLLPFALLALLPATAPVMEPREPGDSFVLRGVRLVGPDGSETADAVVVVRDGRIEAAGAAASTKVPADLPVVDEEGGFLAPGVVVAASRLTLPRERGSRERATPTESVGDAIPPFHSLHRVAAAAGVAVVGLLPGPGAPGGEGLAIRPAASGEEGFLVEGGRLLRVDVDPTTNWSRGLSKTLDRAKKEVQAEDKYAKDLEAYRAASAEFEAKKAELEARFKAETEAHGKARAAAEKEGKPAPKAPVKGDPGKPPAEPKKPSFDQRTAVVRDALRRTVPTVVVCGSAADADRVLDVLEPHRLRLVFRVSGDAWRVAPRIAGAGAAVVLEPLVQREPGSLDLVNPAAVFEAEGCPVAFALDEESRRGLENLRVQVGLLVKAGLPREAALRGLSVEGARILGLEEETGSVAPGRSADLVLHDGDPLEAGTRILAVWVRGRPVPLLEVAGEERP
jgi:hypothetical protein